MNSEAQNREFTERYNKLNAAQKEAVDEIDGPVMVIAGPGTGKTEILSMRIANILLQTDAYPQNILCLTFTDAGVVAMKKRLLQTIGTDAHKVEVCTYHTFCNSVIQQNLHLFEKTNLDAVSEMELIDIFRKMIDQLPNDSLLKRFKGEVYYDIKNFKQLFQTIKKENFDTHQLETALEGFKIKINDDTTNGKYFYVTNSKHGKKGEPKAALKEEMKRVDKTIAAIKEFDKFNRLMLDHSRYDFDDMIRWVLNAFATNEDLLRSYQERFTYILVDEYQDTNGAQAKLVNMLFEYWEQPNIFVVGDDDQSIYRFQGAEVANMEQFPEEVKGDVKKIVLTQNYRSTQPILNVAMELIENNVGRLVNTDKSLSKILTASNDKRSSITKKPIINNYTTNVDEMIGVVKAIEHLINVEKVAANKIAVIYKEHKTATEITEYMDVCNVRYYAVKSTDLFEDAFIKQMILILTFFDKELEMPFSADNFYFILLHYNWLGIQPIEIATICNAVYEYNLTVKKDADKKSFRQYLAELAAAPDKDLFTKNLSNELKQAVTTIEKLIGLATQEPLQRFFQSVIYEMKIVNWANRQADKHYELKKLTALLNLLKTETYKNAELNLHGFLTLLSDMKTAKVNLSIVDVAGKKDGVQLMSFHGSKGLEFEYVFLVKCNNNYWESKKTQTASFEIARYLLSESDTKRFDILDDEERRRLFYVGITRAEIQLTISYASADSNNGKQLLPTKYVDELLLPCRRAQPDLKLSEIKNGLACIEYDKLLYQEIEISEAEKFEFEKIFLDNIKRPVLARMESDVVKKILERFELNVTSLNSYLDCPLGFYYKKIVNLPSAKRTSLSFGTAIHGAIETMFREMVKSTTTPKTFPNKVDLNRYFFHQMLREKATFNKEEFERYMAYGPTVLEGYYDQYIDTWPTIISNEMSIKGVLNDIVIKGRVDKLEFDGHNVNVVDYKTGGYKYAKEKLKPPHDKMPLGGDYWRQAVFYKLLIDNNKINKPWVATSFEFDFIEPYEEQYKKEKIVVTPADITTVTQQIVMVWEKIQAQDFYTGCGKPDCEHCNFSKENNIAIALLDADDEVDEFVAEEML